MRVNFNILIELEKLLSQQSFHEKELDGSFKKEKIFYTSSKIASYRLVLIFSVSVRFNFETIGSFLPLLFNSSVLRSIPNMIQYTNSALLLLNLLLADASMIYFRLLFYIIYEHTSDCGVRGSFSRVGQRSWKRNCDLCLI